MEKKYSYKLCPSCDFFCNAEEPDEYCSLCGAKLIDKCPNCQAPIENPYAWFCKYCGAAYPGRNSSQNKR